jgi:transposase InsO family protein
MSRKGNCGDNAYAESFFKTLKGEVDNLEGRIAVFEYIEMYYTKRRRHLALGYAIAINKF